MMPARLRRLLVALPVTLFFAAACWGQTTMIEGDVKGEDGKLLKDAVIKIDRIDQKGTYKTKTDKKGHYVYAGLPMGKYKVTLTIDGVDKDAMDGVVTKTSEPSDVNFDLKEKAAANAAGVAVPAQEKNMTPEARAEYERKLKEAADQLAKNKALNDAFNAGKSAADAKMWADAIQNFQKASEIDPTQHVVWANLADAYVNLAATKIAPDQKDEQKQDYEKGMAGYQKAIELSPSDAVYHMNYALALAKAGKMPESQEELNKAAQLDPAQSAKAYYNLGAVLTNANQNDGAIEAFKKALSVDPNYAEAHYQLAIALMSKMTTGPDGKPIPPPGTTDEFQKYLQLAPNGPNAQSAKELLAALGQTVETQFSKPTPATKKK